MDFKKNDVIEIDIMDISSSGEGIGKAEGFTFFVKDAIPGDRVRAIVMKLKKTYGFARLKDILTPSAERAKPPCPLYRSCGGCQLMPMNYTAQLSFKEKKVKDALSRIGGFTTESIEKVFSPIVGMTAEGESILRYRNKAQYPVGLDKDGNIITGFYAGRTHNIIKNEDCLLGPVENREILKKIISYMMEAGIKPYDEKTGKGTVRHILIRKGFFTGEIMVCLVINRDSLPREDMLVGCLCSGTGNDSSGTEPSEDSKIPYGNVPLNIKSICLNINKNNTNVILGDKTRTIYGKSHIKDSLMGLTFNISAESFYQVNPVQTQKLYGKVKEYAALSGKEVVWDLYCGTGTIGLSVADGAAKVFGIEVVEKAIEDAKENARQNNIKNAYFYVGAAENETNKLEKPDIVIVDPPRKGCDENCLSAILDIKPKKIIYVSCDPATLARDLKYLCSSAYTIKAITPYDLFPNTVHVETVVLMSKVNTVKG